VFKDLINLDFDQFGRIYDAKNVVEQIRGKGQTFKILDVGGYKGNTVELFPKDEVLIVDQYNVEAKNYRKADALNLPFADGEFDIVLSFDVFEHIEDAMRPVYLKELTRVSSIITVIAAPFRSEENEKAEILSNNFYKSITGKNHPWLIEHIENRLPREADVIKFLDKNKLEHKIFNNNDIVNWNYMQHYILLSSIDSTLPGLTDTNRFYNENILGLESGGQDSYRKIFVVGDLKKLTLKPQKKPKSIIAQLELTDKIFLDIAETMSDKNKTIRAQTKLISLLRDENKFIINSVSWKITKPLRAAKIILKRLAGRII